MGKLVVRALKLGGWLLLLGVVGICGFVNFANAPAKGERDHRARANAEQVIALLAAYHSDHGLYPTSLGDLAPKYASHVPGPREGKSFHYSAEDEAQDFTLGYYAAPIGVMPSDLFHAYDARTGKWDSAIH